MVSTTLSVLRYSEEGCCCCWWWWSAVDSVTTEAHDGFSDDEALTPFSEAATGDDRSDAVELLLLLDECCGVLAVGCGRWAPEAGWSPRPLPSCWRSPLTTTLFVVDRTMAVPFPTPLLEVFPLSPLLPQLLVPTGVYTEFGALISRIDSSSSSERPNLCPGRFNFLHFDRRFWNQIFT